MTIKEALQADIDRLEEEHHQRVVAAVEARLGPTARRLCREHNLRLVTGNGGYGFVGADGEYALCSGVYGLDRDEMTVDVEDEWLDAMELDVFSVNCAGSLLDEDATNESAP